MKFQRLYYIAKDKDHAEFIRWWKMNEISVYSILEQYALDGCSEFIIKNDYPFYVENIERAIELGYIKGVNIIYSDFGEVWVQFIKE